MLRTFLMLIAAVGLMMGCENTGELPAKQGDRILLKDLEKAESSGKGSIRFSWKMEGQTDSELKDCARWDRMKWGEKWAATNCKNAEPNK